MDIYYAIPIALGLAVTGIPLLVAKRQHKRIFSHLVADIGEQQQYFPKAPAADTLLSLIKAPEGAHIRVMTKDFRKDKWDGDKEWFKFIEDRLNHKVKVTAYGGRNIDAKEEIDKLSRKGMEVILLEEFPIEHYATVDKPRQVWIEEIHRGYYAYNCIYSDKPHEDIWVRINNYFEKLNSIGKKYNPEISRN